MGDLENAAVFSLGGGTSGDHVSGHAYIGGDVRVAGNGNIVLTTRRSSMGISIAGATAPSEVRRRPELRERSITTRTRNLDNGVNEAINASNDAFALTPNRSYSNINLIGRHSLTINGSPGETVVLTLRNFQLANNATFTLQGTATTTFIINVTQQFSLSGNARIVLSGGVQWNNVLFNVRGTSSAVSISGNASLQGY